MMKHDCFCKSNWKKTAKNLLNLSSEDLKIKMLHIWKMKLIFIFLSAFGKTVLHCQIS